MADCCSIQTETKPTAQPATTAKAQCPSCGQPGRPVATQTLKHIVQPAFLELAGKPGFLFCPSPQCDVAYFHPDGHVLHKADLRVRVGLKETEDPVPICYCFGFTEAMAVGEIRATGKCTIPQRITAEIEAGNCACEVRNPQGSCCLGNVNAAVKKAMKAMAAQPLATLT